ncbi:hypothetical protein H2O64_18455 [Kordia sp. YSTF-M3]|uniref:Uncharacterized protein n=1 Tax=Kordia aestuariivivens TaxID=2759037 RepID=A0ABR7QDM7_9FLAO|nr:hypothetical protein [Kordia aestuariivivens]MBC8756661.1 hypothetical protein [Kordia aestuariivivens]
MKKKSLNSLTLNKKSISSLSETVALIKGAGDKASVIIHCPIGPTTDTLDRNCTQNWC